MFAEDESYKNIYMATESWVELKNKTLTTAATAGIRTQI